MLHVTRNLYIKDHRMLCLRRNLQMNPIFKSPALLTKSEFSDDHHRVQNATPATKIIFRNIIVAIPYPYNEKSTLEYQNEIFCVYHEKLPPCTKMHTISQRKRSLEASIATI